MINGTDFVEEIYGNTLCRIKRKFLRPKELTVRNQAEYVHLLHLIWIWRYINTVCEREIGRSSSINFRINESVCRYGGVQVVGNGNSSQAP